MLFPPFLIPIICGLVAQALKPLLNGEWYAILPDEGRRIPRYGGMPSAHAAFGFSIATVVAIVDGIHSGSFVIAVALVILILDDALRLRLFLGRHGEALHKLVARLPDSERTGYPYLETRLGHKAHEVVAGAALGIGLSIALLFLLDSGGDLF